MMEIIGRPIFKYGMIRESDSIIIANTLCSFIAGFIYPRSILIMNYLKFNNGYEKVLKGLLFG